MKLRLKVPWDSSEKSSPYLYIISVGKLRLKVSWDAREKRDEIGPYS